MYRYFSYSKILRNSRPPFYYKKIEKYFLKQKKEVQEKKYWADTLPQRKKHLFADKIPEKLCDSHISPLREF